MQHSQRSFDHQYQRHEQYIDDTGPSNGIEDAEALNGRQTTYDAQDMDSLDDIAVEEVMRTEQGFEFLGLLDQQSISSHEDPVPQEVSRYAGDNVSHLQQASIHEATDHTTTEPFGGKASRYAYDPSRSGEPPHDPGKRTLQDLALSEAMHYAYENKLTADYLLNSFSLAHIFGPLVQSTIPNANEDGFTDHSHLHVVEIPESGVLDKSKTLTVTPHALRLIAEARLVQSDEAIQAMTEKVCNPETLRPNKLELPILRTDNKRDMKAFQEQQNLACPETLLRSIKRHRLPLYPQNIEEGEGMELSSKARAESEMMMKNSGEKLSVTRDTLTYLVNQLKYDFTPEDRMKYLIDEIDNEKITLVEKVTPPLSPKLMSKHSDTSFEPALLPSPLDDSDSLLSDNFHAIEDIMLGDHQDVWSGKTSPIREFLKDAYTISDECALMEHSRLNLVDAKVEVPLMLDQMFQQPVTSEDAFNDFVEAEMEVDPEFERAVIHDFSDDDVEEQLQQRLHEAAENSMKIVEQEQLQAIDAVGRVPIPVMDFLIPEPEWMRLCGKGSELAIFRWIQSGQEQLFKPLRWPVDRISVSNMVWNPLKPGAGNVSEKEEMEMEEDEPLLENFLELPPSDKILTSVDYVHYRGKPTVYDDDSGDEDIETQLTRKKSAVDLLNVVRKRVMDTNAGNTPKKTRHTTPPLHQTVRAEHTGPSLLSGDSPGASGHLLANFMEVHAPKKKAWTHSKYFAFAQTNAPSAPAQALSSTKQNNAQALAQPKASSTKAPCPAIEPPGTALMVFISIKIPRRMIRALESLIPDLTVLERNYDAHNTFIWRPGSVVRTEVIPPLSNDADITVSPTTGLIVTSMIRVRQKPRAETNKTSVQIRVEQASLRYERLIVLIGGDGGKDDAVDAISSSDSTALAELLGFASSLECNVQVHYTGGGDKTLANWVAACVCRYGAADPQLLVGLLEPETLWEVFLRRAGFNVFAAQAVASHFKPPSNETAVTHSAQHGLGAFMTMTRDERKRMFGQLVGPRVLDRVSRDVDRLWNRG